VDHQHLDIDCVLAETFVARAEHHATLTSTNDRASWCATEAPGELPLLIVADRQTAGRGRGANRWWTGHGSLAFTLVLGLDQLGIPRGTRFPLMSLAPAVAVVETVAPLIPLQPVGIRWPNDVLAGGGKLAGILVEVLPDGQHLVGIGLNTNNSLAEAPPELMATATSLLELTGVPHDQTTILVTLLKCLETALGQLAREPERIADRADTL
jgi:BirA family biotin operon repressor/biotin-[acetyl-CoA-carboxylase] ligase